MKQARYRHDCTKRSNTKIEREETPLGGRGEGVKNSIVHGNSSKCVRQTLTVKNADTKVTSGSFKVILRYLF